ncbi:sulfatase-like hydrolase/transferase [Streptomyces sp. NPDC047028]|uniref:sulfatase family protein n=1 Tax=Streptomyces sp. NPDC047028 TaxID=3155793 RepID=UPI0033C85E8A
MRRCILFITTDQQRFDSLGCNGNSVVRTPVIDALAAQGHRYERAYNQNTVCMPARSTMLTGQYVRTHGVIANGIPLPKDAPSIAAHLKEKAGYRTALVGKAHFEPAFDPNLRYDETRRAAAGDTGSWRGFDYSIQAAHAAAFGDHLIQHYGHWIAENHPRHLRSFAELLGAAPGGDTGAPETKHNPIPREIYHTDWIADRTIEWLDTLADDEPFFCWMSFPDPHHPWDPPQSEASRIDWRDLDLPAGHPGDDEAVRKVLAGKPAHWLAYYEGRWANAEGGPSAFVPQRLTRPQILEINARVQVMNELIDEACGRVLSRLEQRGLLDHTDVVYTTDHGEMQGDFGLLYKGPYHVDALMRLPLIWRPAPVSGTVSPTVVTDPVSQLDLAPTFCAIAGVPPAPWMQGTPLPTSDGSGRERVLCEWDSQFPGYGMHLRTIYRDGWLCTVYEPSTAGEPNGLEKTWGDAVLRPTPIQYDGTEGELYDVHTDPHQWHNRWSDPSLRSLRRDLVADLYDHLPPRTKRLDVEAPA